MNARQICALVTIVMTTVRMVSQAGVGEVRNGVQPSQTNTVERSFVFVDGRYLEPPYIVTAREGWVVVNGVNVKQLSYWPPPLDSPEKPQIPEDVLKKAKSFYDVSGYVSRMTRWIYKSATNGANPREQEIVFLKSLPFVKQLDDLGNGETRVETSDGMVWPLINEGIPRGFETVKDVEKRVKDRAESLQDLFNQGCFIMYFPPHGDLVFGITPTGLADLALMCEVLASERETTNKLDIVERMGFFAPHQRKEGLCLVSNFRMSDGLGKRIKDLLANGGIKPRRLESLPAESPGVVRERRDREYLRREDEAYSNSMKKAAVNP